MQRPGRTRRAITAVATAAVLGSGAGLAASHLGEDEGKPKSEIAQVLDQSDTDTIKKLVTEGDSDGTKLANKDITVTDILEHKKDDKEQALREYKKYVAEQAEKYGLTVVDDEPYKQRLQEAQSEDEALKILNEFTAHYGFDIKIKDQIDLPDLKRGAEGLMSNFYTMPVEMVKLSTVKEMTISSLKDNVFYNGAAAFYSEDLQPGVGPDGKALPRLGHIGIDTPVFIAGGANTGRFKNHKTEDDNVYAHEIAHGIDNHLLNPKDIISHTDSLGSPYDPKFDKANPPKFKYEEVNGLDGVDITSSNTSYTGKEVTVDDEGEANRDEDKATFYQRLLDGISPEMLNAESSVIKAKRDILMDRLEKKVPNVTE